MRALIFIFLFGTNVVFAQHTADSLTYKPYNIPIFEGIASFSVNDFNNDGTVDLLTANSEGTGLNLKVEFDSEKFNTIDTSAKVFSQTLSGIKRPSFISSADFDSDPC